MKNIFITLIIAVTALVAHSCAPNGEANYKALVANTWELQQIISPDSASVQIPPAKIEITFSDSSTVSGFAGCNNFFGTFSTYEQDQISVIPSGRTMAFCPFMEFEDRMISMLSMCTSYTATGDKLELNDTQNGTTLLFKTKL